MPQYRAIPHVDTPALKDVGTLGEIVSALTENVEILTGQRGPGRAITNDALGVKPQDNLTRTQIRTPLGGTTSAAGGVPTYTEYVNLATDVQQLITDVAKIQYALNTLISNMEL